MELDFRIHELGILNFYLQPVAPLGCLLILEILREELHLGLESLDLA